MTDTTFIYGLVDPRNNQLRYVGKSGDPERRLLEHYREIVYKGHNPYMRRWLNKLANMFLEPEIIILDEVPYHCWPKYEKAWIKSIKQAYGKQIINIHEGGVGGDTRSGKRHKPETLAKMRKAAKNKSLQIKKSIASHRRWRRQGSKKELFIKDVHDESILLDDIKRVSELVGRTPTMAIYGKEGKYSKAIFFDVFGSWNNAVSLAGFVPNEQVQDPKGGGVNDNSEDG